jgi:hypothetical protein
MPCLSLCLVGLLVLLLLCERTGCQLVERRKGVEGAHPHPVGHGSHPKRSPPGSKALCCSVAGMNCVWDSYWISTEREKGPLVGHPLGFKRASLAFLGEGV